MDGTSLLTEQLSAPKLLFHVPSQLTVQKQLYNLFNRTN